MKILFFTDSLTYGGKERRMLELIQYLKQNTENTIALVLTENLIQFEYVYDIDIEIKIIERKGIKYDPTIFFKFYNFCRHFKPDLIHAWGKMTTFYSIPTKLLLGIPLVTNIVSDTNNDYKPYSLDLFFFKADILFSNRILSNSQAGLLAYNIKDKKSSVIWNGVNMARFQQNFDIKKVREELKITTDFVIVMIAGFSKLKDWDLFLDVAKMLGKIRKDITLLGVGDGPELKRIQDKAKAEQIDNVIFPGKQKAVERIIFASDIGILCTFSEGISNSIIECMALGKPVICTDIIGGSKEIIIEGETGYCVERNAEKIVDLVNLLLNNSELRISMGNKGRQRIYTNFSVSRMGKEFEVVYRGVIEKSK